MAKNVLQSTILSANGVVSVAPGAQIEVRNPSGMLVPLWLDRDGTQPTTNPFTTDSSGFFRVYADAGRYHITASKDGQSQEWRDVLLGIADLLGEPNRANIRVYGPSDAVYPNTILAVAGSAVQAKIVNSGVGIGPADTPTFGPGTLNAVNGLYDGGVRVLPIGVGQTWQNVTAQRAWATTYTNTTGRPIAVYIRTVSVNGNVNIFLDIGGVIFYGPEFVDMPGSKSASIFAIIPPGAYYAASSNRELFQWCELR